MQIFYFCVCAGWGGGKKHCKMNAETTEALELVVQLKCILSNKKALFKHSKCIVNVSRHPVNELVHYRTNATQMFESKIYIIHLSVKTGLTYVMPLNV